MSEKSNIEKLISNKGVQFRDFPINVTTRAAEEGEEGTEKLIIEGTPIVYGSETLLYSYRDWDGRDVEIREEIVAGALDDADTSEVLFNYNHCGRVYAKHSARCNDLELWDAPDGYHMRTALWDDDEGHMQLYRDIKRGHIDKMSFAFTVAKYERVEEIDEEANKRTVRYKITAVERLFDVSAVDLPAYDATEISARRLYDAASKAEEAASKSAASVARAKWNFYKQLRRK